MFWRSSQSGAPELERQSERGSLCHICVLLIHRGDVSNFRCGVVGVVGVVSVPFLLFPQLVPFVERVLVPSCISLTTKAILSYGISWCLCPLESIQMLLIIHNQRQAAVGAELTRMGGSRSYFGAGGTLKKRAREVAKLASDIG